ncbi:flagellar assembly protein FliX [Sphingomonas sp. CFBP 8760]|uniref:flagellar assembly protein FliX n=1 Tax=Sphingomonas sp. CFBP 8760 TaxID=2775282 RepID=UPI00177BAF04|nr:flagellar assembly protein FliX [Sphingomonas sp. CFBP 8760]MBD8545649.1 flagellar trans-acting factor FliX [Sphingomonas sp. CFBP 8760]
MRIDNVAAVLRQALITAMAAKPTGGFRAEAEPAHTTPPPATVPIAPPTTSVAMLVAMAANDPVVEQRRKLAAEADRGLSLLERLHRDLATGEPTPERLEEMAAWVEGFTPPDDPALGPVAREIELRVRVELAKHDLRA